MGVHLKFVRCQKPKAKPEVMLLNLYCTCINRPYILIVTLSYRGG